MHLTYYHTLGLAPDCSEADLRCRYLELVRQYPPEKYPERFSKIHEAYEVLNNPLDSLEEMLFNTKSDDTVEQIIADTLNDIRNERLPTEVLLQMGTEQV